jgi:predicted small secreted protein
LNDVKETRGCFKYHSRNLPSLAWFNWSMKITIKRKFCTVVSGIALSSFILSSCDTPTGAGAGYGAAAGAIIGGAATGNVRAASIGAAAGAAAGALIGHSIQEERARAYGPVPPGGWPLARYTDTPGVFRSPYTGRRYDLSGVPPGGLTRDIDTGQLFRRPSRGYY